MQMTLPILAASVDFLSPRLDALGGPWKFPFAGVAIDQARQYNHNQDLAQIWNGCDSAAKQMSVYGAWHDFIIAKAIRHAGSHRLLRSHLRGVLNFDPDVFAEITDFFDQILMRHPLSNMALSKSVSQLRIVGEVLAMEGPRSLIQRLISVIDQGRAVRESIRRVLIRYLPSGESISGIMELAFFLNLARQRPDPPVAVVLKYSFLGCRYPEQLPDQMHQLGCVVGALTSASALLRSLSDARLALRSFIDYVCSNDPQIVLHSWWPILFHREQMSLSEMAAFALTVESVSDKRASTKAWAETRSSWLHCVMDLVNSDDPGRCLIFLSRLAQLNSGIATPIDTVWPSKFSFNSLRSCLLYFERNAFSSQIFTKNWTVQRLAFQFSVSKASSLNELCSALLDLERYIETEALPIDWSRRVALWQFPLIVISRTLTAAESFEVVREGLMRLADCLPQRFLTEDFRGSYFSKWRRQIASCRYLYPLSELLLDLETGLEFEATSSIWSDFRAEWGLHIHSSYTVSTLAQCLLDLEQSLSSNIVRNAPVWRQRLQDLVLLDESGRASALKRAMADMIKAIGQVHWRPEFRRSVSSSNTSDSSFCMQLAACRTVEQIAVLVALAAEMLLLSDGKSFTQDWFRTVQSCHTSFRLSACLIAFDSQLSESQLRSDGRTWQPRLAQVRTWNVANVAVRTLRIILLLLEDHLESGVMKATWQKDSALWRKFCSWQSTEDGIRLATELLIESFRSRLILSDIRSKSVHEILLRLDESVHGLAFNANWDRVQGLCRVSLRRDVPAPVAVAVALEHLTQNIVEDGQCVGRVWGDIPCTTLQMRETLLALQSSIDFTPSDSSWSDHYDRWLKALNIAERPEELAMPILTLAAFIEALPASCPYRVSICFRLMKEIWEHTLLNAARRTIPDFVCATEAPVLLSESDLEFSRNRRIDLSYDRILPMGLYRALDIEHADIMSASSFADLGMGTGLALLQVFCSLSTSVIKCIGIEASTSRYRRAVANAKQNCECDILMETSDELVAASKGDRMLIVRNGDLFECEDGIACDVVLLLVNLKPAMHRRLCKFVSRMRSGSRLITAFHIPSLFERLSLGEAPFFQIPINRLESDRFLLQSCPTSGQRLFIFVKSDISY